MGQFDWATVRACAAHFDVSAHDLERQLEVAASRPDRHAEPPRWCAASNESYPSRALCGRGATTSFGGLPVCWQHHGSMIANVQRWLHYDDIAVADLELMVAALGRQLDRERHPNGAEHLRTTLRKFLGAEAEELARDALLAVWGES